MCAPRRAVANRSDLRRRRLDSSGLPEAGGCTAAQRKRSGGKFSLNTDLLAAAGQDTKVKKKWQIWP
jgi:hypothetical protein